jgi:hypothetical protein
VLLVLSTSARADLEVNVRRDTVVLNDGTEIQCQVLMVSKSGVLIVESDPDDPQKKTQRIIPRQTVRNLVLGEKLSKIEGLQTDTEMARKVIHGAGFRKEEPEKEVADDKPAKSAKGKGGSASKKGGSKTPADPFSDDKSKAAAKSSSESSASKAPAKTVDLPTSSVILASTIPPKELTEAYVGQFPDLQSALDIAGPARVQEWLGGGPQVNATTHKQLESLLKAYVGSYEKEKVVPNRGSLPIKSALNPDRNSGLMPQRGGTIKKLGADVEPPPEP